MENKCGECVHYIQRYAILEGELRKIFSGHCTQKRRKKLDQISPAGELYIQGEPIDSKLVTKKYLTKELLQKLLSMELWEDGTK